jgi:hypothetical protein
VLGAFGGAIVAADERSLTMLTEITAAMGGLKAASEIAKGLVAVDKAMEQAALKMKLVDMMVALSDARTAISEAQGAVDAKDAEIRRLEEALANKAKVVRVSNAYYEMNADGKPAGDPYCARCQEVDHRLVHLALGARNNDPVVCPQCKSKFDFFHAHPIR